MCVTTKGVWDEMRTTYSLLLFNPTTLVSQMDTKVKRCGLRVSRTVSVLMSQMFINDSWSSLEIRLKTPLFSCPFLLTQKRELPEW